MKVEILEANYWEHLKYAKELALFLPIDDHKRIKIEIAINEILLELNKEKGNKLE